MLEDLENSWDSYPETCGVYLIMRSKAVPRVGGTDKMNIIYIGKSKNIRSRLWAFTYGNHTASDFLWTHPTMAAIVLNKPIRSVSDVENNLPKLEAKYSTPINETLLDVAERALLFAYIECYGEAPPLNLVLPKRWDKPPSSDERRWAEQALL